MSLDSSLKSASSLTRHRNVLTRAERLVRLGEQEKWNDNKSVYGLPKVANRKMALAKAEKEETAEGAVPAAGGAAPAAGAKPPAGAKGAAAPAAAAGKAPAGGKAAAPAAKAAAPAAKKK